MKTKTLDQPDQQQSLSRQVDIDFLYLDLNTCARCVGTNKNLESAIVSVKDVLELTGVQLKVNKVLIDSEEKAQAYQFATSPTIRVNGRDIALVTKESRCDSCTDLCGCEEGTDCRVWVYQGQEYTEAPVAMIVEALLQEIYAMPPKSVETAVEYNEVPKNLQNFFAGLAQQVTNKSSSCCSSEEQERCCEPSEKSTCCDKVPQTASCGCQ